MVDKRAVTAGVTLCNGTDLLPSDPVDGTVATIREVELLTEMGLSALDAIKAATHNSAKLCGLLGQTGTISAGKAADLLVIDGRPDVTIGDLRRIQLVMKEGAIFRNELSNLAAPGLVMPGVELAEGTFARVY